MECGSLPKIIEPTPRYSTMIGLIFLKMSMQRIPFIWGIRVYHFSCNAREQLQPGLGLPSSSKPHQINDPNDSAQPWVKLWNWCLWRWHLKSWQSWPRSSPKKKGNYFKQQFRLLSLAAVDLAFFGGRMVCSRMACHVWKLMQSWPVVLQWRCLAANAAALSLKKIAVEGTIRVKRKDRRLFDVVVGRGIDSRATFMRAGWQFMFFFCDGQFQHHHYQVFTINNLLKPLHFLYPNQVLLLLPMDWDKPLTFVLFHRTAKMKGVSSQGGSTWWFPYHRWPTNSSLCNVL